jgi:hypothetical protein
MPGQFSKANRPERPGAYFNFEARPVPRVLPNVGSVVALPFVHDWGPVDQPVLCESLDEWRSIYGETLTTPGYKAARMCFQGEGDLPDSRGGAGAVLAYRFTGASAAKATKVLQNTTPVAALTVSARYEGALGNRLKVTVRPAVTPTNTELLIYLDTVEVERYEWVTAGATALATAAADINKRSSWVTVAVTQDGVALASVTSQALTGGDNGATLIASDWTAVMSALEVTRFSIFAPFDLTDAAVVTSVKTWAQNLNSKGKRFMTVLGGVVDETASVAIGRATSLNDPNFIALGIGTYTDEEFGDLSTSQLAPRIAGILAAIGEVGSLTFARLEGLTIKKGASEFDIYSSFDAGLLVLSMDEDPEAPVRIERALTTYTTQTNEDMPYLIYRSPRYVRIMQGIELELTTWAERNVIGRLPVNDKTREYVVGETRTRLGLREEVGTIQPGWSAVIDTNPPPQPEDEFIAVLIGLTFGRSIEQVFYTVSIG